MVGHSKIEPVAIAVVENNGRYLVGQREGKVALAGHSEFPGGKMLPDESASDAAVRECLEETGLQVRPIEILEVIQHAYDHACVELHFVACQTCENPPPHPHAPFRWIELASLGALNFPIANQPVLNRLTGARH